MVSPERRSVERMLRIGEKIGTIAALAIAVAIASGCGGGSAVPAADVAPSADSMPAADSPPAAQAPSSHLDEAGFWQLIAETRGAAGNDSGQQSSLLEERLSKLPPQAIVDFDQIRKGLDQRLYTWNLWGAAYTIEDGCSDDCFRDFRGYVISLGRDAYAKALTNPDSLASVAQDAETGDWENADNVAPDAYSSRTGNDFPGDDSDLSGSPAGTPFDDSDAAGLARRYPKLAARFR
jgi:Protein of unknown function (DUF4240)